LLTKNGNEPKRCTQPESQVWEIKVARGIEKEREREREREEKSE